MSPEPMPEVTLAKPADAAPVTVAVEPGHIYGLSFDVAATNADVSGQDLTLHFDNGASIVLQGFFTVAGQADFYVRLEDGSMLFGKDLADSFLLDLENIVCNAGTTLEAGDTLAAYLGDNAATNTSKDSMHETSTDLFKDASSTSGALSGTSGEDTCTAPTNAPVSSHADLSTSSAQDEVASMEHFLRSTLL